MTCFALDGLPRAVFTFCVYFSTNNKDFVQKNMGKTARGKPSSAKNVNVIMI